MSDGLDELRSAGEKVDEGRFRIDEKRALEKLRSSRLAEPSHWVLDVLRAAQASGAHRVEVKTSAKSVEVHFDGRPFPATVMKALLNHALGGDSAEPRHRLFALGVAGALGASARSVTVESGKVSLALDDTGEATLGAAAHDGTHVIVKQKLGVKVAAAWLKGSAEARAIRARCKRYGPKLVLDGETLDRETPPQLGATLNATVHGRARDDWETSEVQLDTYGVNVATRRWSLMGVQLEAVVRCDTLRRNASGSDVVDNDPALEKAKRECERLSLERLEALIAEPTPALRDRLAKRLLNEQTLDGKARALMEKLPLFPGPSGERLSIAELKKEVSTGRALRIATTAFPKGSYPEPTVLLDAETRAWLPLLPGSRREDVHELVQRNLVANENKKRWESSPIEAVDLGERRYVATADLLTPKLSGKVGLERGGSGAFIRLLAGGRFLQQGDVALLAPLRLRAVVDWRGVVSDKTWAELPNAKLWSLVVDELEVGVDRALAAALAVSPVPDGTFGHVRDVMVRAAREKRGRAGLSAAVRGARIFECAGGERVSLHDLQGENRWRYAAGLFPWPPLDGKRVLLLSEDDLQLIRPFSDGRLQDVTEKLAEELELRRRMESEKVTPALNDVWARVRIDAPGLHGFVGVPYEGSSVELKLLRKGFVLETTSLSPRYGAVTASVESPALTPAADWSKAVRDEHFEAVVAAVRAAERELAVALVTQYPDVAKLPPSALRYLSAFLKKEAGASDAVTTRVKSAPVFQGPGRKWSLTELAAAAEAAGSLWGLPVGFDVAPLAGAPVVIGSPEVQKLVELGTGIAPRDGVPELARARTRQTFRAQPPHDQSLEGGALFTRFEAETGRVDAALDPLWSSTTAQLIVEGRLWKAEKVESVLPMVLQLEVNADPADAYDGELRRGVNDVVKIAERELLQRALEQREQPQARRALLRAVVAKLEASLTQAEADALAFAPLFECNDGQWRSAKDLERRRRVPFITKRLPLSARSGEWAVLALDEDTVSALSRFKRDDVTDALEAEHSAHARRVSRPAVETVEYSGPARFRHRFTGENGLDGELVLRPSARGNLELYFERRRLGEAHAALPSPFAGAVNSDAITPSPTHDAVERDAAFKALIDALLSHADALATQVVGSWKPGTETPDDHEAALRLCAHLASRKTKRPHALLTLPLLQTTDGKPLSVQALLDEHLARRTVWVAERAGATLDGKRFVWRSGPLEQQWLSPLKLKLEDATDELERAEKIRQRPVVKDLRVEHDSTWRDPISAEGIEGEVVLPDGPTGLLVVQIHHRHMLLERYQSEHAVGGLAMVNSDALEPNAQWTKAVRDASLRKVLEAVETALEGLVAKRLDAAGEEGWQAWAHAAVPWKVTPQSPVAAAVPKLRLFRARGESITVGAVLAEYQRARRVAVADQGVTPREGQLLLETDPSTLLLLDALKLTVKDVTDELQREGEAVAEREKRRLKALKWAGEALVRVPLTGPGMRGELALTEGDVDVTVTLAKQGVAVQSLGEDALPGVAGVVDLDALDVDQAWQSARLKRDERDVIDQHVEVLLAQLARVAAGLSKGRRGAARRHVLAWLEHAGVKTPVHLERLTGGVAALARAPVFETVEGEHVSFFAIADEVKRRGRVAVFQKALLLRPDTAGALGLATPSLDDAWVEALAGLLGGGTVERVKNASAWREQLREEDPPKGSVELWALSRLRRDVRLLRAGSLGQLADGDLEDVRLKQLGGEGAPVQYDDARKLVLLDADHPNIKKALSEAKLRRERLYVLLAAMYGAINRSLTRITDAHEAELSAALAAHLAANPQLLDDD